MRIAVVGAGIAGMSAAWALSKKHDVVLFEKNHVAGGHARTVDVPSGSKSVPADIGFLLFHPAHYPNLLALLRTLDVSAVAVPQGVSVSTSFADGTSWSHLTATPLASRFRTEIDRFQRLMSNVIAEPAASFSLSLGDYLAERRFSAEFQQKFVIPILSMLFVTRFGCLDIGLLNAACCFGPAPLLNLDNAMSYSTVEGGSREYVSKLTEQIGEVRLGCDVAGIERNSREVKLRLGTTVEAFDHVVLATDAHTALRLLDDSTPTEKMLLGEVRYDVCRQVVHTDKSVMPNDDSDWTAYSFMSAGCHPRAHSTYSNYYLRRAQPWITNDIFATANPPDGLIDPRTVIHEQHDWKHISGDVLQYLRAAEMYRIQGKRRTWHCGTHVAESAWHEGSLRTGLAIAVALGASYPFEDDTAAKRSFLDTAIHLMRVVPRRRGDLTRHSVWPPAPLEMARELIREMLHTGIRQKLSLGLPESAFGRFSPLGWIREAATRALAPAVSPYRRRKMEFIPSAIDSAKDLPLEPKTSRGTDHDRRSEGDSSGPRRKAG